MGSNSVELWLEVVNKSTPDEVEEQFGVCIKRALEIAQQIVAERENQRNSVIKLPQMFPRGSQDVLSFVYVKAARLASELTVLGRTADIELYSDALDQAVDLVNYALFLYAALLLERALLDTHTSEERSPSSGSGELEP